MALATGFTFSADTIKKEFQTDPKYAEKLRLFMYGGMQFDPTIASNSPKYVTSTQSFAEDPLLGSWYDAAAATTTVVGADPRGNSTAFSKFSVRKPAPSRFGLSRSWQVIVISYTKKLKRKAGFLQATCLYFGVELLAALGPDAPPIGLIQSAVGGSTIEAWQSNLTLAKCTGGECTGGTCANGKAPTDQHVPGMLYYGYVTPFVNMSIAGFLWYLPTMRLYT
jgi:hypothetical protein